MRVPARSARPPVVVPAHVPASVAPVSKPDDRPPVDSAPRSSGVGGALQAAASLAASGEGGAQPSTRPIPSVRPVADPVAAILEEQATWLEAEVSSAPEPVRARVYLALSEIRAILGDRAQARGFAEEARDLAPAKVLAHHQARALEGELAGPGHGRVHSAIAEAAALVAEASSASLPAPKHHATLLAADALRLAGDVEGAQEQLSRVAAAGDVRGVVGRAALGLTQDDLTALCAFVRTSEAKPVSDGLTAALRLRGMSVGAGGAVMSAEGVCDTLRAARQALETGDTVGAASRIAQARTVPELRRRRNVARRVSGQHEGGGATARHDLADRHSRKPVTRARVACWPRERSRPTTRRGRVRRWRWVVSRSPTRSRCPRSSRSTQGETSTVCPTRWARCVRQSLR